MKELKALLGVFGVGCLGILMVLLVWAVGAFVVVWAGLYAAKLLGFVVR